MARRRKQEDEQPNHERWLVSYADFITLLFAFFVVMYAVSSVNEGKYRVLSNTLTDAFQEPTRSSNPIQVGELRRSAGILAGDSVSQAVMETDSIRGPESLEPVTPDHQIGLPREDAEGAADDREGMAEQKRLGYVAASLESVLQTLIDQKDVSVAHHGSWVEVNMKSTLLFASGSARLSDGALRILRDISRVLRPLPNPVHVEGYTDNVPINTPAYPSNWELSAARAASVVHLFARLGLAPQRLAAIGYGEYRPVADNDSDEGRRSNRRVTLIISAGAGADQQGPARGGRR